MATSRTNPREPRRWQTETLTGTALLVEFNPSSGQLRVTHHGVEPGLGEPDDRRRVLLDTVVSDKELTSESDGVTVEEVTADGIDQCTAHLRGGFYGRALKVRRPEEGDDLTQIFIALDEEQMRYAVRNGYTIYHEIQIGGELHTFVATLPIHADRYAEVRSELIGHRVSVEPNDENGGHTIRRTWG